ncbi:MAG: rod shape-determining protein [Clostridia bacterium]|nr:rod shape-determining protein [Clostridia bacterium]
MKYDLAVDLGTANVVIYIVGEGVVLREPSIAAVSSRGRRKVVAVGLEASRMLGKTTQEVQAVRPLRDGVIADFRVTDEMLKLYVEKALRSKNASRKGHNMVICVPCDINTMEQQAVREAAKRAGARTVLIAEEPIAAAIGAGMDISEPRGSMLIDIGGGTSDIAVISIGGLVCAKSLRTGGVKMDDAIVSYMRRTYNMIIGDKTAESIKIEIGTAMPESSLKSMLVRGRDNVSGMPMSVEVTSREICTAMDKCLTDIFDSIREVLQETPPELIADIMEDGIMLAGGGNLLEGMPERITYETGVKTVLAESPMDCVAIGAGIIAQRVSGRK